MLAEKNSRRVLKFWHQHIPDVLAFLTLAVIAWLIAGFLLRDDVFLFGDHPGHYWITWYTLNVAVPQHARLVDWIPYWYAGYPELQFYPPSHVPLAWLSNVITLGKLPTALLYELTVFVAYALPGLTFFYAIRHLGFERRAALAAGLFGLAFPAIVGGAAAVFAGMLGSRLAWGLNPLILVWAIDFIEGRGTRYGWVAAATLAVAVPTHPYHSMEIVLVLVLYLLVRRLPLLHAGTRLATVILLAVVLDAFWLAPLLAHASAEMIPVIRTTLDQTWHEMTYGFLLPYALLALPATVRAWHEQDAPRRSLLVVLILLVPMLGIAMIADHAILVERLHYYQIDPIRLIGEYYLAFVLLAAVGAAEVGAWVSRIAWLKRWTFCGMAVALLPGLILLFPLLQNSTQFHPQEKGEPRFLSQALADYDLNELWEILRATSGRVMFTSFSTRLSARGTDPFPTTLAALTPLFTHRQLMGGTFSQWSPLGALMWVGEMHPRVLRGAAEEQDDRALFGIPLEELSDEQLYAYCQRFNITTLVASLNDYRTRIFLDASPRFQSYYNNGFFFVYRVEGYANAWIEATHAQVDLINLTDWQIDLSVRSAQSDASMVVKVYAYPLWRAYMDNGQSLQVTRDDLGLIRIALPRGENYSVSLKYEEGIAEQIGDWISILALGLVVSRGLLAVQSKFKARS